MRFQAVQLFRMLAVYQSLIACSVRGVTALHGTWSSFSPLRGSAQKFVGRLRYG